MSNGLDRTWSGQERIAAGVQNVWTFIIDPAQIASCLPDVVTVQVHDARRFDAVLKVGAGLLRGQLRCAILLEPHADARRLVMTVDGTGLGSTLAVRAEARVREEARGQTVLDWTGSAVMGGAAAALGATSIERQARRLIATTFGNVKSHLQGGP